MPRQIVGIPDLRAGNPLDNKTAHAAIFNGWPIGGFEEPGLAKADSYRRIKAIAACALLYLTFGCVPARAAEQSMTLAVAIDRALAENPSLAVTPHLLAANKGAILQSGLRPNPQLIVEVEDILGTGTLDGFSGAESTLSLAWALERGKRDRRVAVARAGLADTQMRIRLQRLEVAAATTRAFLALLRDQERLRLIAKAVELGERAVVTVNKRVSVAKSPAADLSRAQAELAWIQLEREDIEHELAVARRTLAASWGASDLDVDQVVGDLGRLPRVGTFEELVATVPASPLLDQFFTLGRVRDAELALAEARARPNWRVAVGARHVALIDESALVASFTMPLGRNRNQGNIESARARSAMTDDERTATRVEIETTLYRLHWELTHNLHRAEGIRERVLPRVESVLADAEAAYDAGRYNFLELRQAQVTLLDARSALLEEYYLAHLNRAAIERLTGTLLPDSDALGVTEGGS